MKVKDLITKLLDMNMDAEVNLSVDEPHNESDYGYSSGYLFNIDTVRKYSPTIVELVFTDWRKTVESESEAKKEAKVIEREHSCVSCKFGNLYSDSEPCCNCTEDNDMFEPKESEEENE